MRLLVQHQSRWEYASPAALGPHVLRLRPANHTSADIETYGLTVTPAGDLRWQQDPFGNNVARLTYPLGTRVEALQVSVEFTCNIKPVNPFDFYVDDRCKRAPFEYPEEFRPDLTPFLDRTHASIAGGELFEAFLATLPNDGDTIELIVALCAHVNRVTRYVVRHEAGIWSPEQTLAEGRGSCRDSAVLLLAALRSRGLAARFVSGYLIQLADEGMIPGAPKGVANDVVDLHAWAEVFVPGAGWIGLDATSGLVCGEGHIPLACTAAPPLAAPVEGTSDVQADAVTFTTHIERLEHEPQPTRPYEDDVWDAMLAAGDRVDGALVSAGLSLTMGGEPTFNSRVNPELAEWNGEALGADKMRAGRRFADVLVGRLASGGLVLERVTEQYAGENRPRWALDVIGRHDGQRIWRGPTLVEARNAVPQDAARVAAAVARRLSLSPFVTTAFEDPWRNMQDEADLPIGVDPRTANLDDHDERRRLARLLDRGVQTDAGYVLPLARTGGVWSSDRWFFRRGAMYLLPGDGPIGLRLPLRAVSAQDNATTAPSTHQQNNIHAIRTALCVETREGVVRVFLPPMKTAEDFLDLVAVVDAAARDAGEPVALEGYPPPSGPLLKRFWVTPDPGVLEVSLPPVATVRDHAELVDTVFDAALHAGLHSEKYLLDGRMAGSGGGNHITFGGPEPLASPFITRPDLLASLLTFVQHHPSLSYMFSGLFVGPTSEAPRPDEARHDALYELEIALARAHDRSQPAAPWLSDALFRFLLVDVAGNPRRTEISVDKLLDPNTPFGHQGIIELRAFEMPPHPRMITAQVLLMRALIASFADRPYNKPLVRWGQTLHDRFLLPTFIWRDFEDVLQHLDAQGLPLPIDAYRPFLEMRCPVVGSLDVGGVTLQVRNAIEPWPLLGDAMSRSGASRYVDSSMERLEVRLEGAIPERHIVLVNGHRLPLRSSGKATELVGGVRFRAWAPPLSLHPHLGIHHPITFDVIDSWAQRSLGACAYHVWHPEGRGYESPPLTRFEASARRAQRFTTATPMRAPVIPRDASAHSDVPYTLDLRRYPIDRPPPPPEADAADV